MAIQPLPAMISSGHLIPSRLCTFLMGTLLFTAGWSLTSAHRIQSRSNLPLIRCERNLRLLHLTSRRVPVHGRNSLDQVRGVLKSSFLITALESKYLSPKAREAHMKYMPPQPEALLCSEDPEYGKNIGPALTGVLEFSPSYSWYPDPATVAYCPFHRLALLRSGQMEQRR